MATAAERQEPPEAGRAARCPHVDHTHRRNVAVEGDGLVVAFMGGTNVELRFSPDAVVDVDGRGAHRLAGLLPGR